MEKIKQFKGIIIIVIVILGLAFFWFQYRPAQARKECVPIAKDHAKEVLKTKSGMANAKYDQQIKDAANNNMYIQTDYDLAYKNCLLEHGIGN